MLKFAIPKKENLDTTKLTFKSIFTKWRPLLKLNEPFEKYIEDNKLNITMYDVSIYIYNNITFYEDGNEIWVKIIKVPEKAEIYDFILLLENGNLEIKKQSLVSKYIKNILGLTDAALFLGVNTYVS